MNPHWPPTLQPHSSFVNSKPEKDMVLASHSCHLLLSLRRGVQLICCRENDCTMTMPGFTQVGSEEHTQPFLPAVAHALSAQLTCDVGEGSGQWGSSRRNTPTYPPALCSEFRLGLSTNNANSSWSLHTSTAPTWRSKTEPASLSSSPRTQEQYFLT